MKIGVLALQGAFREHREVLDALGVEAVEVRAPEQLGAVDALVLPGGESTTMSMLLDSAGLRAPVAAMLEDGVPVLGTCAGMILLATEVLDGRPDQRPFGAIDLAVRRNGYGRQRDSFEVELDVRGLPGGPFPGVFIRAPVVESVGGDVDVLATHDGHPVLARTGRVWVTSFHPELSGDLRLHDAFLEAVTA
ncbi:MAG TPA: pyridoxal 5'-phosphate synthase glutaminase subunit PdxT [Acidimicrobiia bacterium]